MKSIFFAILSLSIAGIVGCSGAAKKTDAKTAATPAATTEAKAKDTKTKAAAPVAKVAASGDGFTCSLGDVKRELKIAQAADRCTVEYTKDGATKEIATGAPGSKHCVEIAERVKNNLATAGYSCQ